MTKNVVSEILKHYQDWRVSVERATRNGIYVGDEEAYERGYLDALTDVVDILARAYPEVRDFEMSQP